MRYRGLQLFQFFSAHSPSYFELRFVCPKDFIPLFHSTAFVRLGLLELLTLLWSRPILQNCCQETAIEEAVSWKQFCHIGRLHSEGWQIFFFNFTTLVQLPSDNGTVSLLSRKLVTLLKLSSALVQGFFIFSTQEENTFKSIFSKDIKLY